MSQRGCGTNPSPTRPSPEPTYPRKAPKVVTKADRIRQMSDEELAEFISDLIWDNTDGAELILPRLKEEVDES